MHGIGLYTTHISSKPYSINIKYNLYLTKKENTTNFIYTHSFALAALQILVHIYRTTSSCIKYVYTSPRGVGLFPRARPFPQEGKVPRDIGGMIGYHTPSILAYMYFLSVPNIYTRFDRK